VIERQGGHGEEHFTEGEPDLEAPEELAVLEVDEEAQFEEDLDNQVDLEDEVDEDVLETSLDHLVHDGDDEEPNGDDEVDEAAPTPVALSSSTTGDGSDLAEASDLDDLEIEDLEDREESLDRILREKLAGDEEADEDLDQLVSVDGTGSTDAGSGASVCGPDEFVCGSCFLVRNLTQRADGSGSVCRDCRG
jgi:hypothetical protein